MVIAQCGESFLPINDGVGRVMEAYSRIQVARGNQVYIIVPHYKTDYRGNLPYEIIDFSAKRFTKKWPCKIGISQLDRHFLNRIKEVDFDIVHVHGPGSAGLFGLHLAHKKKIPVIGTFHTKWYDDILAFTKSKFLAKIGSKIVAKFYESCDEIWAVSENSAETLKKYGVKKSIHVMQNGTENRVLNKKLIPDVRARYNIKDDIPVLLFVGRITFTKNIKRIIEACSLLKTGGGFLFNY